MDELAGDRIRLRVAQYRAAAERTRELWRSEARLSSEQAFAAALELIALAGDALSRADPVREREVAAARSAWARLHTGPR